MAEPEAFQYALLRAIPSLPRGEALNVGVALYCPRARFLAVRTLADEERLRLLDPSIDLGAVRAHLGLIERVAAGDGEAGAVARLPASERFGWITSPSSTLIQPAPVHTGMTSDPAATLERLAAELVAPPA